MKKNIGNGDRGPSMRVRTEGFKELPAAVKAQRKAEVRELDNQRPAEIVAADAKEAGKRFLGMPERWMNPPGPLWRCTRGHVRRSFIKSEERKGDICLECRSYVFLTYPEDKDGSEATSDVERPAVSVGEQVSFDTPQVSDSTAAAKPKPTEIESVAPRPKVFEITRDDLQALSNLAWAIKNSKQNVGTRILDMVDVAIRICGEKLDR